MFNQQSFDFLEQLSANNNREWFNEHKQGYEEQVRTPALRFIEQMELELHKISPHFTAIAKKVGGSLMRPYRDTRFSKDKTPYKTNVGIQFRHELGKNVHAPGYYLHISREECFLAVGIWRPEASALRKIRELIDEAPSAWKKIKSNKSFNQNFHLAGSSLITRPRGFPIDHINIEDLKRKDFIAVSPLSSEQITANNLPVLVCEQYKKATIFMRFLCEALEVDF